MLFLTSLIFVALFFVLPGEWGLMLLAKYIDGSKGFSTFYLTGLNAISYLFIYLALLFSKTAYEDLIQQSTAGEQRRNDRRLRDFLCVYGCRWLNLAGTLMITFGAGALLARGMLPYPFVFLFLAIIIGFRDIFAKDELVPWKHILPEPRVILPEPFVVPPKPQPKPGEPEPEPSPVPPEAFEQRIFQWTYADADSEARYRMELNLSEAAYRKDQSITRYKRTNALYAKYVLEGDTVCLNHIAAFLRKQTLDKNYSAHAEAMNCVKFVRSIDYISDTKLCPHDGIDDYANFPIETLWEKGGDCEDHGILAAAVLNVLGHDVALFAIELDDCGHIALAYRTEFAEGPYCLMHNGKKYAYVETVPTVDDERIGHINAGFYARLKRGEIVPLYPN